MVFPFSHGFPMVFANCSTTVTTSKAGWPEATVPPSAAPVPIDPKVDPAAILLQNDEGK